MGLNSAKLLRYHFSPWRNALVLIFLVASLLKRQGICAASSFGSTLVQLSPWSWTWPTYERQGNNVNSDFREACCYDDQSKGSNVSRLTFLLAFPKQATCERWLLPLKKNGLMAVLDVLAGWFLQLYSSLSARLITSKLPRKLGLVKWQEVDNQKVT